MNAQADEGKIHCRARANNGFQTVESINDCRKTRIYGKIRLFQSIRTSIERRRCSADKQQIQKQ